ncbi:MAG: hypothetical protein M3Q07_24350 [Pseudobdellovibrionaceae bacterium]|nr:hypothetical protein [Pseudobdellovibrionaceae bacterium]
MRYLWAIVCAFMISTPAVSGGMSGGTGIGGLIEEITEEIQALLKHPIQIDPDVVRRILMRLWVYGEAEIKIGDKTIVIKWKYKNLDDNPEDSIDIVVLTIDAVLKTEP